MSKMITDDDFAELTTMVYDFVEEYIETNILRMSSPDFYEEMIEIIINDVCDELILYDLLDPLDIDTQDDVADFIEYTIDIFLDFYSVPRRSIIEYETMRQELDLDSCDESQLIDCAEHMEHLEHIAEQILTLQSIPQPPQKSIEWHEYRYNLITASNLWKVFSTESQVNSLIYEKCKPLDLNKTATISANTNSPMHWGVKYEPVTVMIYEHMYKTQVGEFGCIPHPDHSFIGASPDGINIDHENPRFGRMLEIKNIVNREITGSPKEEYWIQTQIQMETCDLDECDFVETRFQEYTDATAFYADETHEYKGVILHFIERVNVFTTSNNGTEISHSVYLGNDMNSSQNLPKYRYMPLDVSLDKESIDEWVHNEREQAKLENLVLFSTIYWYLDEFSCVLIPRNREWFKAAVPKINNVWKIILQERIDGYEHRTAKKRQNKTNNINVVSSDNTTKSYMIQNMPVTNSICLIRFDESGEVI